MSFVNEHFWLSLKRKPECPEHAIIPADTFIINFFRGNYSRLQ